MMKQILLVIVGLLIVLLIGLAAALARPGAQTPAPQTAAPTPSVATAAVATPTPAPTRPATAAPTAMPTPDTRLSADEMLAIGKRQQEIGDDAAVATFQSLLDRYPASPLVAEARFRLAESLRDAHREADAVPVLLALVNAEPQHALAAPALLLAARLHEQAGNLTAAIDLYQRYVQQDTLLAAYAQRELGRLHATLKQPGAAIAAYQAALAADLPDDDAQAARRAIAEQAAVQKDYAAARQWWSAYRDNTRSASQTTLAVYSLALIEQETGDKAAAAAHFTRLVQDYPSTWFALQALPALLRDGGDVSLVQQAAVYYGNRQNEQAIAAYQRYLAADPNGSAAGLARYRLAILQQRLGNDEQAIALLNAVHDQYPNEAFARDAWLEVGLTLQRLDRKLEAAMFFEKIAAWYPSAAEGEQALWEAGMIYYRLGRPLDAARALGLLRQRFPSSQTFTRAVFWEGKSLQAAGDAAGARTAFERIAADPRPDYYALRAGELLGGTVPTPVDSSPAAERAALISWLTGWADAQATVDVPSNTHLQRAVLLTRLMLHDDALTEFSLARADVRDNPWGLLAFADHAAAAGLPYQAMAAANRLLALSGAPLRESPVLLQRLLYPAGYDDLARAAAKEHGVDPLWFFALIRQESAFDRYAFSSADARGLTQVIPATASEIARRLGVADFRQDDLFKPLLSLRFGAWLLGENLKATDGDMFVSLAGYNGGLGNALRWARLQAGADFDMDLYVEDIGFAETHLFVKVIYQHHAMYTRLWAGY
jgi:soluble lytic murein transglycosylase